MNGRSAQEKAPPRPPQPQASALASRKGSPTATRRRQAKAPQTRTRCFPGLFLQTTILPPSIPTPLLSVYPTRAPQVRRLLVSFCGTFQDAISPLQRPEQSWR